MAHEKKEESSAAASNDNAQKKRENAVDCPALLYTPMNIRALEHLSIRIRRLESSFPPSPSFFFFALPSPCGFSIQSGNRSLKTKRTWRQQGRSKRRVHVSWSESRENNDHSKYFYFILDLKGVRNGPTSSGQIPIGAHYISVYVDNIYTPVYQL